jgi:hypothetical protein
VRGGGGVVLGGGQIVDRLADAVWGELQGEAMVDLAHDGVLAQGDAQRVLDVVGACYRTAGFAIWEGLSRGFSSCPPLPGCPGNSKTSVWIRPQRPLVGDGFIHCLLVDGRQWGVCLHTCVLRFLGQRN